MAAADADQIDLFGVETHPPAALRAVERATDVGGLGLHTAGSGRRHDGSVRPHQVGRVEPAHQDREAASGLCVSGVRGHGPFEILTLFVRVVGGG